MEVAALLSRHYAEARWAATGAPAEVPGGSRAGLPSAGALGGATVPAWAVEFNVPAARAAGGRRSSAAICASQEAAWAGALLLSKKITEVITR